MRKVNPSLIRRTLARNNKHSQFLSAVAQNNSVQVTTLPNNIRIATDPTPGHFSSVGLYIDAGSRYETLRSSGASHFLDRLAFKSTANRSNAEMSAAIHSLGGQIMCSSSRESMAYQSSHFHQATPLAMSLISDTVLNPAFSPEDIIAQRDAAAYEIREIAAKPEMIIPEILHGVAYGHTGLGNPLLCPEERIDAIDELTLRTCMKDWYRPERMVIAGAGMRHEELVELADKHFSFLKATSTVTQPSSPRLHNSAPVPPHHLQTSSPSVSKSLTRAASYLFPNPLSSTHSPAVIPKSPTSTYTGGQQFILENSLEFSHLYVAYEGVPIHDADIYALATMQVLLGGGGSFSAGGPGKGMYSRLYTHILNHYPQIDHCASFHHIYNDSSLFGLFASFVPAASGVRGGNTASQIMPHLVHQLSLLVYSSVPQTELNRAKNQLKSSLMMALESQSIEVEDIGRQILVHGKRIPLSEMTQKIDEVEVKDIQRVAARVFGMESGGKPTIVFMGHEDSGAWDDVFKKYGLAGP